MRALINYFTFSINRIYAILDSLKMPDSNVSFAQILLGSLVIGIMLKFLFGGFKEFNTSTNGMSMGILNNYKFSNKAQARKASLLASHSSTVYPSPGYVDVWGDGTYIVPMKDYFGGD